MGRSRGRVPTKTRARGPGLCANLLPRSTREERFPFGASVRRQRDLVGRFFDRIEHVRGIAARQDRDPETHLGAMRRGSIRIRLADR